MQSLMEQVFGVARCCISSSSSKIKLSLLFSEPRQVVVHSHLWICPIAPHLLVWGLSLLMDPENRTAFYPGIYPYCLAQHLLS